MMGFPLANITVPTGNQNNPNILDQYNRLRANRWRPTPPQVARLVVYIGGERYLVFWSAEFAVYINHRSENLVQLSGLEQALRRDVPLRHVNAPENFNTLWYHPQVRQGLWEYITADEEYTQPCIPCSRADLSVGAFRHCTPTRRNGDRTRIICARCLHGSHPANCMWPGDTQATVSGNRVNRNQRPIQQLMALNAGSVSPSPGPISPIRRLTSPVALVSPPRGPLVTPTRPASGASVKREDANASPMSLASSMSRMSLSPGPGGATRDTVLERINSMNLQRNYIVYGTGDLPEDVRRQLATAWNQARYTLSWEIHTFNQTFRNALAGYIAFGNPPQETRAGPDPAATPHRTPPRSHASVSPPPAPPRTGSRLNPAAISRITPQPPPSPGPGGAAPRGPPTGAGTQTGTGIASYFQLDPANLPPLPLSLGLDARDAVRLQNVYVPQNPSPAMDLLFSAFFERHRNDPTRTLPTANWTWDRMRTPMYINPVTGNIHRIVWRTIHGSDNIEIREFFWHDFNQRWDRAAPDYTCTRAQRDEAWYWERGG